MDHFNVFGQNTVKIELEIVKWHLTLLSSYQSQLQGCRFFLNLIYIITIIYAYTGIEKHDTVSIFLNTRGKTLPFEHVIISFIDTQLEAKL